MKTPESSPVSGDRRPFWVMSPDGNAIEDAGGQTLCLWPELLALLTALAPRGWAPVGSILAVLLACSQRVTLAEDCLREMPSQDLPPATKQLLQELSGLPRPLRSGLQARAHLLTVLFEDSPRSDPAVCRAKLHEWKSLPASLLHHRFMAWAASPVRQEKTAGQILEAAAHHHGSGHWQELLESGIVGAVMPLQVDSLKPLPVSARGSLLEELEWVHDPELMALAKLARRMVAMVSWPSALQSVKDLPVGGVSGLSHRGTLDRLLTTELASGDDLLLARLAHQEALFYERDHPPGNRDPGRLVLMDSGAPLWGLPRLFLLAAALGFAETARARKSPGSCLEVRQRNAEEFSPLRLETLEDVKDALKQLPAHPDAAPALHRWKEWLPQGSRMPDVIFLTGASGIGHAGQSLHSLACQLQEAGRRLCILSVDRSGKVEWSQRTSAGSRILKSGWIDPDLLLQVPAKTGGPEKPAPLLDLPALMRELQFYQHLPLPLRLPARPWKESRLIPDGEDLQEWVGLDLERRLMSWAGAGATGAMELSGPVPPASDYHLEKHHGRWVIVCLNPGNPQPVEVIQVEIGSGRRTSLVPAVGRGEISGVRVMSGAVILVSPDRAVAHSLKDGAVLSTIPLLESAGIHSVFFDGEQISVATTGNREAVFPVPVFPEPPPAVLGVPLSAGFASHGSFVIRAPGGRWEWTSDNMTLAPSYRSQLAAVRPFRSLGPPGGLEQGSTPCYVAEWNPGCRMFYDPRGLIHLVFHDFTGPAAITFLCLPGRPGAAWIAGSAYPFCGAAEWQLSSDTPSCSPHSVGVFLHRFAVCARQTESPRSFPGQ